MPPSPRGIALEHYRQGTFQDVPDAPDCEPGSPEALQFLESIRERRFASLAHVIRAQLDHSFEASEDDLVPSDNSHGRELTGWQKLHSDMLRTLHRSGKAIEDTEAYEIGQRYSDLVEACDPNKGRHYLLSDQLVSGSSTGVGVIAPILQSLPRIIEWHDEDGQYEDSHVAIARHSVVLPGQLALTSVNQMMAARKALVDPATGREWGHSGSLLNPSQFTLVPTSDAGAIVNYADFWGMEAPAGYTPMLGLVMPLHGATVIGDIQSEHTSVIGCPMTLLPGYMQSLLNKHIDFAVEHELLR